VICVLLRSVYPLSVTLSVCLSVTQLCCANYGRTVWGEGTLGNPRCIVLDGGPYPPRRGNWDLMRPWPNYFDRLFLFSDSLQDYCGYERFNARCTGDHVINVRRALYGRMQPGRCITGDYGHVMGCYADVTAYVSGQCDYRQNCTLLVATMDSVAQPCAKDFKSYLQAYYVCIRGKGQFTRPVWTGELPCFLMVWP